MVKDPTIAIRDCLAEIAILEDIARRMTLDSFRSDSIARRAAAYAIQTISEAVPRIPDDWLADFPTQPWAQIKGIGNRIRHEYFRIDVAILWEIVTTDAPRRLWNRCSREAPATTRDEIRRRRVNPGQGRPSRTKAFGPSWRIRLVTTGAMAQTVGAAGCNPCEFRRMARARPISREGFREIRRPSYVSDKRSPRRERRRGEAMFSGLRPLRRFFLAFSLPKRGSSHEEILGAVHGRLGRVRADDEELHA